jgi:hypothetical protein
MLEGAATLVLNYNGKADLGTCLSSVLAQTERQDQGCRINIGSIADSVSHVRWHCPVMKVICLERSLAFAEAYNHANRSVESNQFHQGVLDA